MIFIAFLALYYFCINIIASPNVETSLPLPDGKIVGGYPVDIEDYPYQIALLNNGNRHCGGSIISPKYIVTAAHCTYNKNSSNLSIQAGSSTIFAGGTLVNVSGIFVHKNFNSTSLDFDISILELYEPLVYSDTISSIGLAYHNVLVRPGSIAVVSGWGYLEESVEGPVVLHALQIPIMDNSECSTDYGKIIISDRMICAGLRDGGKESCWVRFGSNNTRGDSGGPLVVRSQLVGIVSWGYGCARPNYPGIYSSIPVLRTYITSVTGI